MPTEVNKGRECGIDPERLDGRIELLGRRPQERGVLLHAFVRRNLARLPICLDVAPAGIRKPFQQAIRWIIRSDRPIEIEKDVALSTHDPRQTRSGTVAR